MSNLPRNPFYNHLEQPALITIGHKIVFLIVKIKGVADITKDNK